MALDYDVLEDLKDHIKALLLNENTAHEKAERIANSTQQHFRKHWGGQNIYFKKSEDLSPRDMEIYNKYDGKNKDELMREYDVSQVWFYQIIKKARAEYIAKTQKNLF